MYFRVNTSLDKFYVFGLALLLTVTLAGCGGGGKKAATTTTVTPTPTDTGPPTDPGATPTPDPGEEEPSVADQIAAEFEKRDIKEAQDEAKNSNTLAQSELEVAEARVIAIALDATAARNAANNAMAARTDYATADEHAKAAEAIRDRANAAIVIIRQAAADAQTAYDTAMSATTRDDAETARDDAAMFAERAEGYTRNINAIANGMGIGFNSGVIAADDARKDAEAAVGVHVLGLLMAANPVDDPKTPAEGTEDNPDTEDVDESMVPNENADRVAAVETALEEAAMAAPTGGSQHSTDATAVAGISVAWPADVADNPDTPDDDESSTGMRGFTIRANGEAFTPDNLTADPPTATSKSLTALGDFVGVELAREPETGNNVYVHIYTDITQEKAGTPASAVMFDRVVLSAQSVGSLSRITLAVDATVATTAGTSTFTANYDHDDDGEDPIANASFSCTGTNCAVTFADNEVTQLGSGWTVSGVRDEGTRNIDAVAAVPDPDYLTFGVWLSAPDTTGGDNTGVEVGSFSSGNLAYTLANALTGSATYEGPAVGVKSMGGEVSHVDGTATLMANFGMAGEDGADDTAPGTVSGMVDIGDMTVHLGEDSEIASGGAFSGNTRAGAVVHNDDGTNTYMYTGMWGGSFYGPSTVGGDGDDANDPVMPTSAAGTFGVSGGKDDAAMSLIGAFGATKQ